MPTPLYNIRVLDLSRVLAGPYCAMLLADYGAEVIKVERPKTGDDTRQWGPPWVGEDSAYYMSANRNKRSMTLDLKSDDGQDILRRLIDTADVVIENFRPGTLGGWGLGYEDLRPSNPGLIMCAITGYGQTGPYRDRPGYDFMIQAQGGLMSITGPAEGEPHKVGVAIVDLTTGLFSANAILAALYERQTSGEGQYIDVALLDTSLAALINVAHNTFASGRPPQRQGNAHANIVPYQTFTASDGRIAVALGSDEQYRRLCEAGGRPELWEDVRFQSNAGRVSLREELVPQLQEMFVSRTADAWIDLLLGIGIPVSRINDVPTILSDPQVQARQMVQEVDHPTEGPVQQLGPVAKLSRTPATVRTAPPLLGADTAAVLRELGYSAEETAELAARQIT